MAVVGSRASSSFCSAWIRPVGILPPAGDQCDTAAVDSGHGAARIYVTADIYSELNWTVTSHQYQHCVQPAGDMPRTWDSSSCLLDTINDQQSRFCFWRNDNYILRTG